MSNIASRNLNYDRPIEIGAGVYWIGFYDKESGLHCNPYLIIEGDEAIVIDGGSRPDFPTVMMKILQTGLDPLAIKTLIYQHYDPDLCGSIPNFEKTINNKDLKIISHELNNVFIRHYFVTSELLSINSINQSYKFSSGRELKFIPTPYAHSPGSFVTLDSNTGIIFTSDLFGSFSVEWELFLAIDDKCKECKDHLNCVMKRSICPLLGFMNFHRSIMPSGDILKHAIKSIMRQKFSIIAPQHGSIIHKPEDINFLSDLLLNLEDIGIDALLYK